MGQEEVPDFPEICAELLLYMLGILSIMDVSCGMRTFCYSKRGPHFEQCSLLVKDIGRCVYFFLLDSMALVLLLTKGRTLSFPVLAVIRRIYGIAYRAKWLFGFSVCAVRGELQRSWITILRC